MNASDGYYFNTNKYTLVENEDEEVGLSITVDDVDNDKPRLKHSESLTSLSSYGSTDSYSSANNWSKGSSPSAVPRNLNSISVYELSADDIGKHHQNWEVSQRSSSRPVSPDDYPGHSTVLTNKSKSTGTNTNNISIPTTSTNIVNSTSDINSKSADFFLKTLFATGSDGQPAIDEAPTDSNDDKGLTEYVVLDFTDVTGVDATAARSCFLMLMQLMRASGITVAFSGLAVPIENLLRAHRVIKDDDVVIPVLDDCLEWFEEQILYKANTVTSAISSYNKKKRPLAPSLFNRDPGYYATAWQNRKAMRPSISKHNIAAPPSSLMSTLSLSSMRFSESDLTKEVELVETLKEEDKKSTGNPKSVRILRRILCDYLEVEATPNCPLYSLMRSKILIKYFERKLIKKDDIIIDIGDTANNIFIIEEGSVEITKCNDDDNDDEIFVQQRIAKIASGGVFGEAAFFLRTKFQYRYTCLSDCSLWTMSRESYAEMEQGDQKLCLIIQHVLLKSLSLTQNKLINE